MRYIICEEGTEVIPDRYLVAGSLACEDDRLPVTPNFDHETLIGYATDIQRDDNFVWTAEIEFFNDLEVPKDSGFSINIAPVDYHIWKDVAWCTQGRIREVALVPYQFWPQTNE